METLRLWSSAKQIVRHLVPPVCRNVNRGTYSRNCLLSYITKPFRDPSISVIHQNRWQARELAGVIGGFGYNVDVVDWYQRRVRLTSRYDLVVDTSPGHNDVVRDHIAEAGTHVALLTTSNPVTSNNAERARLERIAQTRGVRLKARWNLEPLEPQLLESCGAFWLVGNSRTLSTYSHFQLPPVALLRNTGYPFLYSTDTSRRSVQRFLFIGSRGHVHKGLDLLLEAFAQMPELTLYVCGHLESEGDFCKAYREELFETPNIVPVGFLDIRGERFRDLVAECGYVVMPSCAEGMSGSVLTGMSAGLVPVVSRECGFNASEVHHFEQCSVDCIRETIHALSRQSKEWMREQSLAALNTVRERYAPEHYGSDVRAAMRSLNPHHQRSEVSG